MIHSDDEGRQQTRNNYKCVHFLKIQQQYEPLLYKFQIEFIRAIECQSIINLGNYLNTYLRST